MTAFTTALWLFVLIPLALACIIVFLWCNAKRHIVTDPAEQAEMLKPPDQRMWEAGG